MRQSSRTRRHGFLSASGFQYDDSNVSAITSEVIEEDVLVIEVEDVGSYLLMWTPTGPLNAEIRYDQTEGLSSDRDYPEALALAAGFCFTESIISGRQDIRSLAQFLDTPGVVRMQLVDPSGAAGSRRNVMVTSSCGICGGREAVENSAASLSPVANSLRIEAGQLRSLMAAMRSRQSIFEHTGGAHAAAIFDAKGEILAVAEDLGRHNALDKLIGQQLLQGNDCGDKGVLLTSRLSFEMVVKAARAGFQMICAVSAPTSLAIETAERVGMTLCGFVRSDRATVYTHPWRAIGVVAEPQK